MNELTEGVMHTSWWLMTGGGGGGGGGGVGGVGGFLFGGGFPPPPPPGAATAPTMVRARMAKMLVSCMLIAVVVILWNWKF